MKIEGALQNKLEDPFQTITYKINKNKKKSKNINYCTRQYFRKKKSKVKGRILRVTQGITFK